MKAKLKKRQKSKAIVIGAPQWDGTVTIDGKRYEPGKEYTISKEIYEQTGLFTQIKENKKDE